MSDGHTDVCRLHAEAYARARGFELTGVSSLSIYSTDRVGVSFDVVVGKGDIALNQRTPGVLDNWRWSAAAVQWWTRILNRADGREGKVLSLVDDRGRRRYGRITGMRSIDGDPGGLSVDVEPYPPTLGEWAGPWTEPWTEQRADGKPLPTRHQTTEIHNESCDGEPHPGKPCPPHYH